MLNTKPVKYLQSRPHHIKLMMFAFTMFTAGVVALSFLATSLRNNLIAADVKKSIEENRVVEVTGSSNTSGHSLFENLKANISELSGSIGSVFSGTSKNNIPVEKNNISKNSKSISDRKIKPAQLPIDQQ